MNLEQKINNIITEANDQLHFLRYPRSLTPIEYWEWKGCPFIRSQNTPPQICPLGHRVLEETCAVINQLIYDADKTYCLIHPYKYIRECKLYYDKSSIEAHARKVATIVCEYLAQEKQTINTIS